MKKSGWDSYFGIYHSADADGWASAAIYKYEFGDDVEIVGYNYGQSVEHILEAAKDKTVIMTDVTFSWENTLRLAKVCKKLIICDHHETFYEEWIEKTNLKPYLWGDNSLEYLQLNNIHYYYKKELAGCEILWKKMFYDVSMPPVIEYLGIYDTAREGVFTNEPTELGEIVINFTYGFRQVPYSEKIDTILQYIRSEEDFSRMCRQGEVIRKYSDEQNNRIEALCTEIKEWCPQAEFYNSLSNTEKSAIANHAMEFESFTVAATNTSIDPSQFKPKGEYDFIVCYYKAKDGLWKYSLRPGNNQNKNPNLRIIAEQFEFTDKNGQIKKGGGHENAAGFFYNKNLFE